MLKGKNAIVTGARRGIGKATVKVFAENKANIWACARSKDENFEKEIKEIAAKNEVEIWPIYFDITDDSQVKAGIQQIKRQKKNIDILANIAGIAGNIASFSMSSIESMRTVMENNFFSATLLTQYVSRLMVRQQSGSIIFVSSIAGVDGTPSQYGYAASKAAMLGGVKNLAREMATNNIRVNAVAPGIIETDMGAEINEDLKNEMLNKVILKRAGSPTEVANVIAFLGSDISSYITSQVIRVDGGGIAWQDQNWCSVAEKLQNVFVDIL